MSKRQTPRISSRKLPQQARSNELVTAILEAAIQVLAKEGAHRFTTTRVAERAGVSVGSIYQYFPNKASILFRLQSEEWRQTAKMLCHILQDTEKPPLERLRNLTYTFIHSECEEAEVRVALNDAAPLYRDTAEAREARTTGEHAMQLFLQEALPQAPAATRILVSEIITSTLSAVGKKFSEAPRTTEEIDIYATALSDMLCAYLQSLEHD